MTGVAAVVVVTRMVEVEDAEHPIGNNGATIGRPSSTVEALAVRTIIARRCAPELIVVSVGLTDEHGRRQDRQHREDARQCTNSKEVFDFAIASSSRFAERTVGPGSNRRQGFGTDPPDFAA